MRPTDENQPASTRPNLMSPRRTTGEDSILAMLEREPARMRGTNGANPRLVWYGAGAAVALALTTTLVWLAAGNDGLQPDMERAMMADAGKPAHRHPAAPAGAAAPPTPLPAVRQVAMATSGTPALQSASAAVIVDQAPPGDNLPPLRLLKPAPATPAAAEPVRVPVPAPKTAVAPPPRPATRTAAPASRPVAAPPGETARREPRQAARQVPAPAPARARPVVAARNAVKPAPGKPQRSVNPARTAEPQVDADVALISAVIVHANGHAPEGSHMTELLCPNDSCKEKPARP